MKSLYDDDINRELVESLKSMEVTPPLGLWNEIEATLESKSRKRLMIVVSWASAAVVGLLITIGGFYMLNSSDTKNVSTIANANPTGVKKIDSTPNVNKTNNSSINERSDVSYIKQEIAQVEQIESVEVVENIPSSESVEIQRKEEDNPTRIVLIEPSVQAKSISQSNEKIKLATNSMVQAKDPIQKEEKTPRIKRDWVVSSSLFPVYSFHTAGAMHRDEGSQEMGITSWGGSISVRGRISPSLSIESGILLNSLGQTVKDMYLISSDESTVNAINYEGTKNSYGTFAISSSNGVRVQDDSGLYQLTTELLNSSSFNKIKAEQLFRYIEVPVLLVKNFKVKYFKVNLKTGFSAGFIVDNNLKLTGQNIYAKGETKGVDPVIASALFSAGLSLPVMKKVDFVIEPSFRLCLNTLSASSGKSFPFSTYVKFGFEVPI